VAGAWWGGFAVAVQDRQTQPPTSPQEYMDLRVGPGKPEQVMNLPLAAAGLD